MLSLLLAMIQLWLTGDYVPAMGPYLGEEDSALVDYILTTSGR